MPNTTNFNWSTPADTDLVKNGASAIRTLGSAIDTSFVDFKGGTTGQVLKKTSNTDLDVEWGTASSGLTLINTTSFSAVASQSVNNVFTSTYDNYRILCRFTDTASGGSNISLRMRVAGVDASGATTYKSQQADFDGSGSNIQRRNSDAMVISGSDTTATQLNTWGLDIFSPALATATAVQSTGLSNNGSGYMRLAFGNHAVATAYDGFTFFSSGNMTGIVRVYGYSN
jgi:hypothetical protein